MQQEQRTSDFHGLILVIGICAWLAGILIGSLGLLPTFAFLAGAAITLLFIILFWYDRRSRLFAGLILCLLLGAWRYTSALLTDDPLALSTSIGQSLTIRGSVSEEPKLYGNTRLLSITAHSSSRDGGVTWQDAHGQLTIQLPGTEIENPYSANYGSLVKLTGKLLLPLPHSTPNIQASMFFPQVHVTGTAGNPVLATLYTWRITLSNILAQVLPQPYAALLIAILLGLRTPALRPLIAAFNVTGTAHLIVPSGFKVTLLTGLVASSTRWVYTRRGEQEKPLPAQKRGGWRRWLSTSFILISIITYTILSGAGAAAIRAGVMGSLLVIAPRIGRTYNIYTALTGTALLLSINDPFVLWDVGFQLSFLGTLGIVLLTPLFQRLLLPVERIPLGHLFNEIFSVTLAAQIATLPILIMNFYQFSLAALLANILTVPLLGTLILSGILICGLGLVFLPLAMLIGWITWPLLVYLISSVQLCAVIPYASNINMPIGLAWCYYALLALIVSFSMRKWPLEDKKQGVKPQHIPGLSRRTWQLIQIGMALLTIAITGMVQFIQTDTNQTTLTFLNVTSKGQSQGEAILLRTPDNKTLLIDGGLDATSLGQELDSRLPSWQRSLDYVLLTTPRPDHLNGLLDIVQRYTISEVIDGGMLHPNTTYAQWRRTISERNILYRMVSQNTSISIGKFVSLQILWPTSPLHKGSDEVRDNGLILRIVAPGVHFLLLGAGAQSKYVLSGLLNTVDSAYQQAEIVQMIEEINIPFPEELDSVLQRANPALLLITPATLSKNQKMSKRSTLQVSDSSVLQKQRWQNVQTLRTAQIGTVEIDSSQQGWRINPA